MDAIPRDKSLDSSLALLRDGYRFVQLRRQRDRSDIFRTRLMLETAICIGGEEAARSISFRRAEAIMLPAIAVPANGSPSNRSNWR